MAHPRTFRFGVTTTNAMSGQALTDTARRVESLGYSSLFMSDHFAGHSIMSPMVGISYVSAVTSTLRVGTLVLGNDFRHPVGLAKEAATLDLLSGGRLELGIGAGWMTEDYRQLGLVLDEPGVRIERLAEAIDIMRRCWTAACFSHEGTHYRISDYTGMPQPLTSSGPPLMIGGGSPKILRLAGRVADIVGVGLNLRSGIGDGESLVSTDAESVRRRIEWVREGAGSRFDDIELQLRTYLCQVTDRPREVIEQAAARFAIPSDALTASRLVNVGTTGEIVERLSLQREDWGFSYIVVEESQAEGFAPVVAELAGR